MISYVDKYGEFSILDTISFLSAAAEKTETIIDNYRYLIYLYLYLPSSDYTYLVGGLEHFLVFHNIWECHHPNCYSLHDFSEGWRKKHQNHQPDPTSYLLLTIINHY